MKKTELSEMKKLDTKALQAKAKELAREVSNLVIDKNMNKLADKRVIGKKRDDLARVLTIVRQKQLLSELEGGSGS